MRNIYVRTAKTRKTLVFSVFLLSVFTQFSFAQNVGITDAASITPNYLLHVHKNAASGALFQLTNTSTSNASSDGFVIDIDASLNTMFKNQEASGIMTFYTNGSERIRIDAAGNVGIGISSTDDCAILSMKAVNNRGILIPNLNLTSLSTYLPATGTARDGLLVYNTNNAIGGGTGYYYWSTSASKWINLSDDLAPGKAWLTEGNTGLVDATNNFLGTTDATPVKFITNGTGNIRMTIAAAGTVGINATPSANYQLYVTNASTTADDATIYGAATGNAKTYGVYGSTSSTTTNGSGVYGVATGASGVVNGVWGYATASSGGSGVFGIGADGVYGTTNFTNGNGVNGYTNSSSGASTGVNGETASTTGWGVYGTSPNIGTVGYGSNTAQSWGVYGLTDNATGCGVRGHNSVAGATIGFGGFFSSLATTGSGVAGSLGSSSYFTGAGVSGFTANTIAGGKGVIGECSNATGIGVQGQTSGSTGKGLVGLHAGTGAGIGVSGQSSAATGTAIAAYNTAASGSAAGFGITSLSNQTGGVAIAGSLGTGIDVSYVPGTAVSGITASTVAAGTGVYGACDNATGVGLYGQALLGRGGYFVSGYNTAAVKKVWGAEAYITNSLSNDGNGYAQTSNNSGAVKGYNYNGAIYTFGVAGWNYNDDSRCAGTFGANQGGNYWGALGYKSSGLANYGMYSTATTYNGTTNSNTGKILMKDTANIEGMGVGVYGGVLGGWVRGDIYGFVAKGSRYSLYVDGKTYTNDIIAQVSEAKNSSVSKGGNKKIVSYVTSSTTVDIYSKGTGELTNGSQIVTFENNFRNSISSKIPVVITVSPMGECNGVYVTNISENGFTVKELNGGNSNVKFSWIAIGTKFGYENPENPEEILEPSYDANMNGVMFNENNTTDSATPIWWDGSKLRFDKQPEQGSFGKNGKTQKAENLEIKTIQSIQVDKVEPKKSDTETKILNEKLIKKSGNSSKNDLKAIETKMIDKQDNDIK